MIEICCVESRSLCLTVRLRAIVTTPRFVAFAGYIERVEAQQILLDWRLLLEGSLQGWSASGLEPWRAVAHRIERVAIIHDAQWNRQAALLAAVLHRENVLVRSWRPSQLERAHQWLHAPMLPD